MISNTRTLSPSVVNEFRFGATKFYNNLAQELQYKRNVHQEVGLGLFIPPPISWGLPNMTISGFSGFGDNPSLPFTGNNSVFQFIDNVSWIRGNHSMRMGAEIRRDEYNMVGTQEIRGSLNIDRPVTGYSFADYMLGMISGTRSAGALGEGWYRAISQAYFIQDTWRMRPNITLDLGLRYEYTPPWLDVKGEMMNVWVPPGFGTPSQQGKPCFIRVGSGDPYEGVATRFDPAICVARDGRLGDRLVAADKTNFAPRIGVVWSPSPKTTVRTGYGIFYAQDSTNPVFDMSRNIQGRITAQSSALTLAQPYDGGATNPCGVQMPPQVCVTAPQVLGNQYDRRTPFVEQYLRQLPAGSRRQHGRGDRVLRQPGAPPAAVHHAEPAGAWHEPSHPWPCSRTRAGELADDRMAWAIQTTTRWPRRSRAGCRTGSLVWCPTPIRNPWTTAAGFAARANQLKPQQGDCWECENGRSVFDVRHRLTTSFLYELPFGTGRKYLSQGGVLNAVAGGWQLAGMLRAVVGIPAHRDQRRRSIEYGARLRSSQRSRRGQPGPGRTQPQRLVQRRRVSNERARHLWQPRARHAHRAWSVYDRFLGAEELQLWQQQLHSASDRSVQPVEHAEFCRSQHQPCSKQLGRRREQLNTDCRRRRVRHDQFDEGHGADAAVAVCVEVRVLGGSQ